MRVRKAKAPVRGSKSGRPIMALLDLLGQRWVLRILWELREEPASFRVLRERCDRLSPSVLNERHSRLREAGIVGLDRESGYGLTGEGKSLVSAFAPLNDWARRCGRLLR